MRERAEAATFLPVLPGLAALLLALAPGDPPEAVELRWVAPGDCPDAGALRRGAAALLGRPIDPAGAAPRVLVTGAVVREAGGFRLDLELRRGDAVDRRTLRDLRCDTLAESAALIVAAAIDPDHGRPPTLPPEPAPVPEPAPPGPPAAEPVPAASPIAAPTAVGPIPEDIPVAAPVPPTPARDPLRGAVRLAGVFDQGSLSAPTGGPALALALLRGRWRVELGALYLAPQVARPAPDRDLGARLSLGSASLRGCAVGRLAARLELAGCGGLEAGALIGQAVGAEVGPARPRANPWLAGLAGAAVSFTPRPRLALVLDLGAAVPLVRPAFTLEGFGTLFKTQPAAFRGVLAVEARFR